MVVDCDDGADELAPVLGREDCVLLVGFESSGATIVPFPSLLPVPVCLLLLLLLLIIG